MEKTWKKKYGGGPCVKIMGPYVFFFKNESQLFNFLYLSKIDHYSRRLYINFGYLYPKSLILPGVKFQIYMTHLQLGKWPSEAQWLARLDIVPSSHKLAPNRDRWFL